MKKDYFKLICDKIMISVDDLTPTEKTILEETWNLFEEKLDDIQLLNKQNKMLGLENANLKAMQDESDYFGDDLDLDQDNNFDDDDDSNEY
jgi:hypothetical protein